MGFFKRIQQSKLEKLLEMENGYVLNFSNKTFESIIIDSVNAEIYDVKYSKYGDSKAKRLKCFWDNESGYKVKKLLNDLIEYKYEFEKEKLEYNDEYVIDEKLFQECRKIVDAINDDGMVEAIDELEKCELDDPSIELLMKNIRDTIENHEFELALDRMHTFSVKYIRNLCCKHGIQYDRNKPLHSCYGEYIKYMERNELIETDMTRTILKYSISIFDSFNYVRNNQSYAHDNKILNYHESKLIFRSMSSVIAFIESIERQNSNTRNNKEEKPLQFEFPF